MMGLIRKTPGQKIKIIPEIELSPAKMWVSISLLFLILSGFSWVIGDFSAKANIFAAFEDESDASLQEEVVEGSCDVAEEDGLSVICGTVKSARIEKKNGALTNGEPIENVTVAVYESDPESPTGKTTDGALTHLFSSTSTNADGRFRVKARKVGARERNIYIAFLCNGQVAALKRTKSTESIPSLPVHVNCASGELNEVAAPSELPYVDRSADGAEDILSCITNPLRNVAEIPTQWLNVDSPREVAFYNEPPVTIQGEVTESNYDFRYISREGVAAKSGDSLVKADGDAYQNARGVLGIDSGGIFNSFLSGEAALESSGGAYWENDCVIKYVGGSTCLASGSDTDLLHYIPKKASDPAYRTKEIRFNFKQTNIDPLSMYGYLKAVYGDVSDSNILTYGNDLNSSSSGLPSCEDLKNSKNTLAESDYNLTNTKLTTGPGLGLSSPYSCEEEIDELGEGDLRRPACEMSNEKIEEWRVDLEDPNFMADHAGKLKGKLLWSEILDNPKLKSAYFRCDQLALKGGVVHTDYTSEVSNDSGDSAEVRGTEFELFSSEADNPYASEAYTIIPGRQPQKALEVAGVSEGSNKINVIDSPYKNSSPASQTKSKFLSQQYTADNTVIWDIGAQNMTACSVSTIAGDISNSLMDRFGGEDGDANLLTHIFNGVEQHFSSPIAATAAFSTEAAKLRDAAIKGNGTKDRFDTLLRASAEGTEANFTNLSAVERFGILASTFTRSVVGSGNSKTFGERMSGGNGIEIQAKDLNVKYPLHEGNFEDYFPAYGDSGYPGGHEHYPWREVDSCDVYGTAGNPGSLNDIRTCKVTRCEVTTTTETPLINPITKEEVGTETETTTSNCSGAQRETCLTTGGISNGICEVQEAGPYNYVAPLQTQFRALVKDGGSSEYMPADVLAIDALSQESADLSNAFASPNSGSIIEKKLATLDVDYSGSSSGIGKLGFDVPEASGGVPEHMYTISASPTAGATEPFNDIYYHCNIEFEGRGSVDDEHIINPTWDCKVNDIKIKNFGICDYVDPSTIGNLGTAKPVEEMIEDLKNNGNWNDLITRNRGDEGWDVVRRCYGQVVKDSLETGNDPALVLAIWIEESAASNYSHFGNTVKDFGILEGGCNGLASATDFKSQLACFLKKQDDYQGFCSSPDSPGLTVEEFLGVYHLGQTDTCDYSGDASWRSQVQNAYSITHRDYGILDMNKLLDGSTTDWSR